MLVCMFRGWVVGLVLVICALASASASAATHEVGANGNPFAGGLSFTPALVEAKVGDTVRWTNTDPLVPHTATERNGLWDLTGVYGATPLNPPGFGPGDSRERVFEAGTFSYICDVHPDDMAGLVNVRPRIKRVGGGAKPRLLVTWATVPPAPGQVFDVQRRDDVGWRTVRDATAKLSGKFAGSHGRFRARVRLADNPLAASDYSPVAKR
jgi:plastocyanin